MAENVAATYMFMFLESAASGPIKGETMDVGHTNEIQIKAFDIGVSNPNKTAGDGDWKPVFDPLKVTIFPSRATPFMFKAACDGSLFKRITISCRKSGTKASGEANGDYLQWRFHNARLVNYTVKTSDDTPSEEVEFSYQIVEMAYIQQAQNGSLIEMFQRGWMVGKNVEFSALTLPYKGGGAK